MFAWRHSHAGTTLEEEPTNTYQIDDPAEMERDFTILVETLDRGLMYLLGTKTPETHPVIIGDDWLAGLFNVTVTPPESVNIVYPGDHVLRRRIRTHYAQQGYRTEEEPVCSGADKYVMSIVVGRAA